MKKTGIIYSLGVFLLLVAVYFTWQRWQRYNPPYSPEINAVLFMAGDNRTELEKVLKHYSKNTADSLKLKAVKQSIKFLSNYGLLRSK